MIKAKVKVQKKIFVSQESGFGVFKVAVQGKQQGLVIVGNLFDVNEGDFLEIEGEATRHPRFGEQVKVSRFEFIMPQDGDGIIRFLSSGRIKGLGKKTAEKIYDHFGADTLDILEKEPDRLREIKGMKKTIVEEMKKNAAGSRVLRELTVKLSPFGIGGETIFKLHKEFGEDALDILEQDPYVTIEKIRGIGFKTADTIARAFGIPIDDPNRLMAGIDFLLNQFEQRNGDLYVEEDLLLERSVSMLAVDEDKIMAAIELKLQRSELVVEKIPEKVLLSLKNFILENSIARKLFDLSAKTPDAPDIEVDPGFLRKRLDLTLTDEQEEAVRSAVANPLTIVTGGPGTGKTTIIRAIIEVLLDHGKDVAIAAPTGRAAKRIEETAGYSASTIHRLLKVNPETRAFVHNDQNPLQADTVIVDESSMIDSFVFFSLLKALDKGSQLIIIGDKDQLPSVGPGNILRDIIQSGYFNTIYLSRNFRQNEDSLIIDNAYRINNGEPIHIEPYSDDLDFVMVRVQSEEQALQKVLRILEYHQGEFSFNSQDLQILIPMYRGEAGIDNVNHLIQERFNPGQFLIKKEKIAFKMYDKVMQLRNNYEKEIFNGEQGTVEAYDEEEKLLSISFDGYYVEYHTEEIDELTISYAMSVHKSQGSEYDTVILVLLPSHSIMLNREIFYTAVTRAKRKLYLISDEHTVERAILNSSPRQRKTLLPLRLQQTFEP